MTSILLTLFALINVGAACLDAGWQQITPFDRLLDISADSDGAVYGIKTDEQIYKLSTDESSWDVYAKSKWSTISVGDSRYKHLYALGEKTAGFGSAWDMEPERTPTGDSFSDISVGSDGTVWAVKDSTIYKKRSDDYTWDVIAGPITGPIINAGLEQIDVEDANHIIGLNRYDKIYKRNTKENNWKLITGSSSLRQVSAAFDGTVYGVNGNGYIYKLNKALEEPSNSWSHVCHSADAKAVSVVDMALVYMIDEDNKVYKSTKTLTPTITYSYSCDWRVYRPSDTWAWIRCQYEEWGTGSYYYPPVCPESGYYYPSGYLYGFCQTGCINDVPCHSFGWLSFGGEDCGNHISNHLCFKIDPVSGAYGVESEMNKIMDDITPNDGDDSKPLNINLHHNKYNIYYEIKALTCIGLLFIGIIWLIYNVCTCGKLLKSKYVGRIHSMKDEQEDQQII